MIIVLSITQTPIANKPATKHAAANNVNSTNTVRSIMSYAVFISKILIVFVLGSFSETDDKTDEAVIAADWWINIHFRPLLVAIFILNGHTITKFFPFV